MRSAPAVSPLKWLRLNGHNLGPLTGTDTRALLAIDAAWELFACERAGGVLVAIGHLAAEMQPHTRPLARELIAKAMDWTDRERYWPQVAAMIDARLAKGEGQGG